MPRTADVLVVTGGIGSGKSFVVDLLRQADWEVVDSDVLGHRALELKKAEIVERWPDVERNGAVDRKALAGLVFANVGELLELELITHPVIESLLQEWIRKASFPAAIEVSAPTFIDRLTETPILVVDSSMRWRRDRAIARGMAPDDFEARLAAQPSRNEWLAGADFVFDNDRDLREAREVISGFDLFWRHR